MTKILYIGHYKEQSDWSRIAINNIKAIKEAGVEIVCRNIPTSNTQYEISKDIKEIESNTLDNVTHCIQHVLPNYITGTKAFNKNIAYYNLEYEYLNRQLHHSNLDLVDEVWVPNKNLFDNLSKHISTKIKIIPVGCDEELYSKSFQSVNIGLLRDYYKFYFIGELDEKNNIFSLVKNFCLAFKNSDHVALVINAIVDNKSQKKNAEQYLSKTIDEIKKSLKLYKNNDQYPIIKFIIHEKSQVLTDVIMSLHSTMDCFVSLARSEAWGCNIFDAMKFGKHPIVCNYGGPSEYITSDYNYGTLIGGIKQLAVHPNWKTNFLWFEPQDQEIVEAMRKYYNAGRSHVSPNNIKTEHLNLLSVGNIIRKEINE
jgi:glycosyltransferase involved in cell wall biosynthesis